ncbi:hypothetical protein PFISCL1PPCAC_18560, partial [Pristionchus fissidentatus]
MKRVVIAMRGQTGFEFLFSEDGFGPYFGTGVKRRLTLFMMKGKLKKLSTDRAMAQGMGRHSMEELNEIGKQTLKSICIFLGDKPYFGGDKPTTLDATMFGHLAGLVYMPTANGLLNKYIMENYPNLVKFVERIKEKTLPNLSPWSLKLETWLRMADIPFTNINNEFKMFSVKGQVPFVELDGRQIADSSIIINDLTKEFGKTDMEPTDPKEKAIACAFSALAEEHLTWAIFAMRGKTGFEFIYSDDGYGRYHGTGWMRSIFQYFMQGRVKELTLGRANAQGMGRHSLDELNVMAEESLKAMSAFLGDKPYFGGDKPITLDATMFGHLCGLVYMPTHEG